MKRVMTVCMLLVAVACASVPLKDQILRGVQITHQVIAAAQDSEIALYESGTVAALTLEKHKQFHAALIKGFDAEGVLIKALRAWRAGDPVPASMTEYAAAANEAMAVIAGLLPVTSSVITAVQEWVSTALELQKIFRSGTEVDMQQWLEANHAA